MAMWLYEVTPLAEERYKAWNKENPLTLDMFSPELGQTLLPEQRIYLETLEDYISERVGTRVKVLWKQTHKSSQPFATDRYSHRVVPLGYEVE